MGPILVPYGPIWAHMGPYGPLCDRTEADLYDRNRFVGQQPTYRTETESLTESLRKVYGIFQDLQDLSRKAHKGPYGPIWTHMGPNPDRAPILLRVFNGARAEENVDIIAFSEVSRFDLEPRTSELAHLLGF